MNAKLKTVLKFVLSLALAGVLLWLALRSVDWKEFWEGLKLTRWVWLVPFFVASVGALVFRAFRWRLLLRSTGLKTTWLEAWDANNVGNLANLGIPGAGEVLRCGYVSSKSTFGNVFGTVLMERLWDIVAIFLMLGLSLVLDRHLSDRLCPKFCCTVYGRNRQGFLRTAGMDDALFVRASFYARFLVGRRRGDTAGYRCRLALSDGY